jgi:hypothetical protein
MMTMEATGAERQEGAPRRCEYGIRGGERCWRVATERPPGMGEGRPVCCAEHLRLVKLGRELDGMLVALEAMGEWIRKKVDSPTESKVKFYAYNMRDEAEVDCWRAAVAEEAADIRANQGEGEEPIAWEQGEHFAALWLRSEAISTARGLLLDAREDVFGRIDRWPIIVGLRAARESARDEVEAYKREIGLK